MRLFRGAPPPLPEDIQSLLASERVIVAQPEEVRARTMTRASAALRADAAAGRGPAPRGARRQRLAMAAAMGLVLAAGIASAYRAMVRPEAVVSGRRSEASRSRRASASTVVLPPQEARPALPQESAATVGTEAAGSEAVRVVSPKTVARHARPGDDLRELRLLDRARQADMRGEHESVLAAVSAHEREFPAGRLTEEREVMRVKALVSLGRDGDARRAVARFHREFPRSVLSRKLDDMLARTP